MILYGPPGSSKTTIAKKLALDLGWPLLVVNQSEFLRGGIERLDAEAVRLCRLVGYLRDTVTYSSMKSRELVQGPIERLRWGGRTSRQAPAPAT